MGFGKDKLHFDATESGDIVASFLKAADGTLITHTGGALDVYIDNASIAVTATDLDIRDLDFASDSVDVSGSEVSLDAGTISSLQSVTESNLTALNKAEDAAHSSGHSGIMSLNVRQDTPASSTSDDGDYQSFKSDAIGRLWMNDSAHSFLVTQVDVADTAGLLVASSLANRKRIIIENVSSKPVYVGGSAVAVGDGMRISGGSSLELPAGAACALYGIVASGTADVRVMELT